METAHLPPTTSLSHGQSMSLHRAILRPNHMTQLDSSPAFPRNRLGWACPSGSWAGPCGEDHRQTENTNNNESYISVLTSRCWDLGSCKLSFLSLSQLLCCLKKKFHVFLSLVQVGFLSLTIKYFPEGPSCGSRSGVTFSDSSPSVHRCTAPLHSAQWRWSLTCVTPSLTHTL